MQHDVRWLAIYNDGSSLPQFADGTENKYTDIDRSRLVKFILFVGDTPKLVIHLDKNKRLIYRRRVALSFSGHQEIVYLAGWQELKHGINTQMICFLFEDGHIETVDRFYENHPWFYPVKFLPGEQI